MTHGWSEQKLLLEARILIPNFFLLANFCFYLLVEALTWVTFTLVCCAQSLKTCNCYVLVPPLAQDHDLCSEHMGRHSDAQRGSICVFRLQVKGSHKVTHTHIKHMHGHIFT